MQLLRWIGCKKSTKPRLTQHDFSFLAPCPSSGLIIQGEKDDVVTLEPVSQLCDKLHAQKGIEIDHRTVGGANHFFHDKVDDLMVHIHDHMNNAGNSGRQIPVKIKKAPAKKAA